MKITAVELSEYNYHLPPVMPPEEKSSSNSIPFYSLRNRSFMLLSCMLLNLAESIAVNPQDDLQGDFIPATVDCLKELKIQTSKHGITNIIEKPNCRVRDLQAALEQSARALGIGRS